MYQSFAAARIALEQQKEGVPFDAIEFLYQQPSSAELTERIVFALRHAYDGTYYDEEIEYHYPTPLWYAIVAENHLSQDLIDPIVNLYTTDDDWDFLSDQGMFVLGRLAQKYPDTMMERAIKTIDQLIAHKSHAPYLFLFDAFYFIKPKKYQTWLLNTLAHPDLYWVGSLAHHLADIQMTAATPIIETLLLQSDEYEARELEECLRELRQGHSEHPSQTKPYCQTRGPWREHYKKFEDRFDDDDDEAEDEGGGPGVPQEKIGRNSPCPCGSKKKFKKCCLS